MTEKQTFETIEGPIREEGSPAQEVSMDQQLAELYGDGEAPASKRSKTP